MNDVENPKAKRRILFNGLAKKDGHYVNLIALINKKKENRGEVHAFDFNNSNKLEPLILQEKVLYTNDLEIPDIFRKIDINFKDNKVEITEFNKFQIKQNRIMEDILYLSDEDRQKLIKLQSFTKMMIRRKHYILQKDYLIKNLLDNK